MSANKKTVERYLDGFRAGDHAKVLSCLTDDVEWVLPGAFHMKGKVDFDGEIENPAFEGRPVITVKRTVEENDVVVSEGVVRTKPKGAPAMDIVFCDVFEMKGGRIRKLTSYLMPLKP